MHIKDLWQLIDFTEMCMDQSCFILIFICFFSSLQTVRYGFPYEPTSVAFDPVQHLLAIGTKSGSLRMYPSICLFFTQKDYWKVSFIISPPCVCTNISDVESVLLTKFNAGKYVDLIIWKLLHFIFSKSIFCVYCFIRYGVEL